MQDPVVFLKPLTSFSRGVIMTMHLGRVAQRESAALTLQRPLVRNQPCPPSDAEPWCSRLTRRPVKPEIAGSSPVGSAIFL
jgi:hypothetical protein